jgi:SAM-dependent methyltransferase
MSSAAPSQPASATPCHSANDPKKFWNRKARTFPRYSPGEDNYEAKVLALARANGAVFSGARVLDVGCGTGLYTIRLAQEAKEVVGVDFSEEMLAVLREDAERLGLKNLSLINSDWVGAPLEGEFDLVFCSMCPAMGQPGGYEKVLAQKKAFVVYLGWNGLLRSEVLEGLYERHKIVPKTFDAAKNARALLEEKGIDYRPVPVEGTWRVKFSKELLTESVLQNLNDYGVEPDEAELAEYLEKFREPDGQCLEVTDYKIQMLLWRNF